MGACLSYQTNPSTASTASTATPFSTGVSYSGHPSSALITPGPGTTTRDSPFAPEPAEIIQTSQS